MVRCRFPASRHGWLCRKTRRIAPLFENTGRAELPEIDGEEATGRVVIGSFSGLRASVRTASDTLYVDITLKPGGRIPIPAETGGARDLSVGRRG